MKIASAYREMIHEVTQKTPGSHVGLALYLDYVGSDHFEFSICYAAQKVHRLRADVTSLSRLQSHWDGLVSCYSRPSPDKR